MTSIQPKINETQDLLLATMGRKALSNPFISPGHDGQGPRSLDDQFWTVAKGVFYKRIMDLENEGKKLRSSSYE